MENLTEEKKKELRKKLSDSFERFWGRPLSFGEHPWIPMGERVPAEGIPFFAYEEGMTDPIFFNSFEDLFYFTYRDFNKLFWTYAFVPEILKEHKENQRHHCTRGDFECCDWRDKLIIRLYTEEMEFEEEVDCCPFCGYKKENKNAN